MAEGSAWGAALRIALVAYAVFAAYAWFFADRMLFQPHAPGYGDAPDLVRVPVTGGHVVAARWLPSPAATHTLLYSHGNGEDLGDLAEVLEELRGAGFSVLAWDYRGYGLSTGRPTERATYRDAEAVYRHLTDVLGVPPGRVIVHGRSLGGGPAAYLASRHPVGGVVLESTFTSVFAVFPGVPVLPFDKFRNEARLARVRAPVLVIHGTEDTVVPFAHGRRLYERAPEPRRHLWIRGAGHDDLPYVAGDRYLDALRAFAASLPVDAKGPPLAPGE